MFDVQLSIEISVTFWLAKVELKGNVPVELTNEICISLGYSSVNWINIALPIGISFFSFQKVTYSVDVY